MKDSQHRTRNTIGPCAIVVIACVVLVSLVCVAMYTGTATQLTNYLEHPPQATVDYKHHLPSSAQVIEGWADVPDVFGDFSMKVAFTLPDEELDKLLEKGFAWFPSNWKDQPSKPDWQIGLLPQDLLQSFDKLENRPKNEVTYTYFDKWDKQWHQLVIIDRERRLVYYARDGW